MLARPELLIGEIIKPSRTEEASWSLYWQLMDIARENDYFGLNTIVITDNNAASEFRPLEALDQFNAVATMASLRQPTMVGESTALEMWQTLTQRSRLTGIWAWKFPAPKIQKGTWPMKRWETNREAIIDMGQRAVLRLLNDPSTNMTGFKAKPNQSSYFLLFGDVNDETLRTMSHLWRDEHSFMFRHAPVNDVYIIRLAAVDEKDVEEQIEKNLGKDRTSTPLKQAVEELGSTLGTTPQEMLHLWGR
jgi:hypothetical protein